MKCKKCTMKVFAEHNFNGLLNWNFRDSACDQIDLSKIQRCVVTKVEANNDGSKLIKLSLFGNSKSVSTCIIKDSWLVCSMSMHVVINCKSCLFFQVLGEQFMRR